MSGPPLDWTATAVGCLSPMRGSLISISLKTTKREGGSFPASAPGLGYFYPVPAAGPQVWSRPFKPLKRGSSKVAILSHSQWSFTSFDGLKTTCSQQNSLLIIIEERPSPAVNSTMNSSWVVASHCSHSQPGCSDASVMVGGVLVQPSQFQSCLIQLW